MWMIFFDWAFICIRLLVISSRIFLFGKEKNGSSRWVDRRRSFNLTEIITASASDTWMWMRLSLREVRLMTKDYFRHGLISVRLWSLCCRYSSVWTCMSRGSWRRWTDAWVDDDRSLISVRLFITDAGASRAVNECGITCRWRIAQGY